jgi:polyadenylate-binding protein
VLAREEPISIRGNEVKLSGFISKDNRLSSETTYNNLYVRGFPDSMDNEDIKKIFREYGDITSVLVMPSTEGKYGFVCFANSDSAREALETLNN